jgi:RNA polymerase sigma-70 factor (ECF subfamily)
LTEAPDREVTLGENKMNAPPEVREQPPRELRSRLFIRHQNMLRSYIWSLVGHRQDADDLLQEVGVLVLAEKDEPVDPGAFPAWCRKVAHNFVLHYWRSRRRAKEMPSERYFEIVELAFQATDAEEEIWAARRRAMAACIEQLTAEDRELLSWRYGQELDSEAIAQRRRRTASAIRMAFQRIRRLLLRCIDLRLASSHPEETS